MDVSYALQACACYGKNHFRWAADNKIEGTPTTFVNSKMLPSKIEIADLMYIIN